MKYLIVAFLLFSFNSHACNNWISVSELERSQKGEPAKAGCKKGEKCFCYEGIDLRGAKIGMKEVDDKTKPIYEEDPELGRVLVGYEQKQVEGLIVDEQKKRARLEKEAQKEAERQAKQARKERRQEAKEQLLDAIMLGDMGNELDKAQIKKNLNALKAAIKGKKIK